MTSNFKCSTWGIRKMYVSFEKSLCQLKNVIKWQLQFQNISTFHDETNMGGGEKRHQLKEARVILRPLEVRFGLTSSSKISIAKAPSKFEDSSDVEEPSEHSEMKPSANGNSVDEDIVDFLHE